MLATIFKYEPELRQLFTQDYLLAQVRNGHIAGIKGRTDLPPAFEGAKPKPAAGILVEVLGEEGKTAVTDKQGRYLIKIAGGEYMVRFSGENIEPVVLNVVVELGVDRRVNVVVGPPTVAEVSVQREAVPAPPSMNEVLSEALREVADKPTNGEVAAQNGMAMA